MAKSQTFAFPTVNTDEYQFQDWSFSVTKGPIMKSICNCQAAIPNVLQKCHVCQYEKALKLPQLPEMIFPDNKLTLRHAGGAQMDFIGLDALQLVNAEKDENEVKVLASKKWTEARKDVEGIDNVAKPFDWTYTTRYSGTLNDRWKVTPTDERIDLEKLKVREPILFYQELPLFEDELADNGCSDVTVRFRVMPSGFFALQRQYVRVDHMLVRVYETRLHWTVGKNYLLREFSSKQNRVEELTLEQRQLVMDPTAISQHLKLIEEKIDKLEFC